MASAVLTVRGVSKAYGNIQALTDVNLEVPSGGIFGIVGPNGAGSSPSSAASSARIAARCWWAARPSAPTTRRRAGC